jgi:ATP-binding cassette subfamily F protein 3
VKLLLDPPNLLLMDEPTTHLDMASIEALMDALKQFSGTIIFISHDVYFIRELCTHVVRVEAGRLTHYSGGWQYYLDKTAAQAVGAVAPPVVPPAGAKSKNKEQKRFEAEARQARHRERTTHQTAVAKLEADIQKLEARQKELTAELENPASYEKPGGAMALNREWLEIADHLKVLAQQWEQAAVKLEETNLMGSER